MAKEVAEKAPATKVTGLVVLSEFTLPSGAVVVARKPNNGDRRSLLESPDMAERNLMEYLACLCATKIEYKAGHEEFPDGAVVEFSADDNKKETVWSKLDALALEDSIAYIEAFGAKNWPSQQAIKEVLEAAKAKK